MSLDLASQELIKSVIDAKCDLSLMQMMSALVGASLRAHDLDPTETSQAKLEAARASLLSEGEEFYSRGIDQLSLGAFQADEDGGYSPEIDRLLTDHPEVYDACLEYIELVIELERG